MLNLFSNDQTDHINHGAQYARAFPGLDFGEYLEVEYFRHASHTFTHLDDQAQVEALVSRWVARFRRDRSGQPEVAGSASALA